MTRFLALAVLASMTVAACTSPKKFEGDESLQQLRASCSTGNIQACSEMGHMARARNSPRQPVQLQSQPIID